MKYLTGFAMAWGNFCCLPCPVKKWDDSCKSLMLGFLPTIGLVIGLIWAALYVALVYLGFFYIDTAPFRPLRLHAHGRIYGLL